MSTPTQNSDLHKMIAEMFLQMQEMRSELQSLRCEITGKLTQDEGWATPAAAAAALKPEGVKSPSHLKSLRLAGALSEARGEIRNVGQGERPTWEYHIPKCRAALQRYFKRRAG